MTIKHVLIVGQRFGRWKVLGDGPAHIQRSGAPRRTARVICECGEVCAVMVSTLVDGQSKSCGCLHKDIQRKRIAEYGTKHGKTRSGAWKSWAAMRRRCDNPKNKDFKHYGGRGIKVCERWRDFENFYADMGDRPEGMTIERDRVNEDYEPGNCRWATQREQCLNRRNTRRIEFNGKAMSVREWAAELGVSLATMKQRLKSTWPAEHIFSSTKFVRNSRGKEL